ncbi:MAG: carboxypeptidase-like regulatory domain-containing protein, partial [Terriglobales bacterium]
MKRSTLAVQVVLLIVSVVAFAVLAQAQYRTSIQGVVTDSTGAVVQGATLTLTNPATSEKWVRTSNGDGVFNFNALAAAVTFQLEVDKTGFQKKVLDHLDLIPDQANALNVTLDVGSTATTVNV